MRRFTSFLFAFVACIAMAGCHAQDVRGCPVIIGYGAYDYIGWQVLDSGSGAGFTSDQTKLGDGKPGTLVNLTWTNGAQTTATWVIIQALLVDHYDNDSEDVPVGVIAVLNTSLPEGLKVEAYVDGNLVGTTHMAESTKQGRTDAWFVFDTAQSSDSAVQIKFYNDVNGSSPLLASQAFSVGEIFAGAVWEAGMKRDPTISPVRTGKIRQSANGVQWDVLVPLVRQMSVNIIPLLQKPTFLGVNQISSQRLIRKIMEADVVAIIPFLNDDPASYRDPNRLRYEPSIIAQTAFLGQLAQPPSIKGNGDRFYDFSMQFTESA